MLDERKAEALKNSKLYAQLLSEQVESDAPMKVLQNVLKNPSDSLYGLEESQNDFALDVQSQEENAALRERLQADINQIQIDIADYQSQFLSSHFQFLFLEAMDLGNSFSKLDPGRLFYSPDDKPTAYVEVKNLAKNKILGFTKSVSETFSPEWHESMVVEIEKPAPELTILEKMEISNSKLENVFYFCLFKYIVDA